MADFFRDGVQGWLRFAFIIRMVGKRCAHNKSTILRNRYLGVVILIVALIGAVLRDTRIWIGKVELSATRKTERPSITD